MSEEIYRLAEELYLENCELKSRLNRIKERLDSENSNLDCTMAAILGDATWTK